MGFVAQLSGHRCGPLRAFGHTVGGGAMRNKRRQYAYTLARGYKATGILRCGVNCNEQMNLGLKNNRLAHNDCNIAIPMAAFEPTWELNRDNRVNIGTKSKE